jgi:hypothetical protein
MQRSLLLEGTTWPRVYIPHLSEAAHPPLPGWGLAHGGRRGSLTVRKSAFVLSWSLSPCQNHSVSISIKNGLSKRLSFVLDWIPSTFRIRTRSFYFFCATEVWTQGSHASYYSLPLESCPHPFFDFGYFLDRVLHFFSPRAGLRLRSSYQCLLLAGITDMYHTVGSFIEMGGGLSNCLPSLPLTVTLLSSQEYRSKPWCLGFNQKS